MKQKLIFAALFSVALLAASVASAQGPTIPEAWSGIWNFTTTQEPCGGGTQIMNSDTDTLCVGEMFEVGDDGVTDCTGGFEGNTLNWSCSAETVEGDCTISITLTVQATLNGDTITGTQTVSTDFEGCGPIPNTCIQSSVNGTRTGPAPQGFCSTPVEETTWGQLKALYD